MRILITRTDRIGDVVLSLPVIQALREYYPNAYLAFCVQPFAEELIQNNPYLDEILLYDKKGAYRRFGGMLTFARLLRRKKFDKVFILHPTLRMNLSCFMAGIPERYGYDKKGGIFLTARIKEEKHKGQKHETEYTLDVIRRAGIEPSGAFPKIWISEKAKTVANDILRSNGINENERFIVIHPGASCHSKRWAAERFAALIDGIKNKHDIKIVLVGGGEDTLYSDKVMELSANKPIDMTGKTGLLVLAALLERARLFISNDSGPIHIASSVKTPVIDIFGRKDPGLSPLRWGPIGDNNTIFHEDPGCDLCLAHNCENGFLCLEKITVKAVLDKVADYLS